MHASQPFYKDPSAAAARVLVLYRQPPAQASSAGSNVGLGVNALHTARVLRRHGVQCDVAACASYEGITAALTRFNPTHVVIEAIWVGTEQLTRLLNHYHGVHFLLRCHSQVGFLQVEAGAVRMLREAMVLQDAHLNLDVGANSQRFAAFCRQAYNARCAVLPNLYDLERQTARRHTPARHPLRVGSFGAIRLLKNHSTAAAAALLIARGLNLDLEFHLSVNRVENGRGVLDMIRNLYAGLRWAKVVEVPWEPWPAFRETVGAMDLNLQPSFTETFNIVTADSVAAGVPVVVSDAIEWAPPSWQADVDDAQDVARVGLALLANHDAAADGLAALQKSQRDAVDAWRTYLGSGPTHHHHSIAARTH